MDNLADTLAEGLNKTGLEVGMTDASVNFYDVVIDENKSGNYEIFYGVFVVLFGAFCFGTMHVPIRRYATEKDGIFVQWVMSFGSLMVGFVVNIVMGSPPVQLAATGGGVLWTFANSIAQFVISGLGLAPALLLWSTTNILTGWSAGRFGLFGLRKKVPEHEMMNVVGLVTILTGGFCFAFIKKRLLPSSNKQAHVYPRTRSLRSSAGLFEAEEGQAEGDDSSKTDDEVFEERKERKNSLEHPSFLLSVPQIMVSSEAKEAKRQQKQSHCQSTSSSSAVSAEHPDRTGPCKRFRKWMMRNSHRLLCICLSLISGLFYSATVIPVIYIQDHPELFPDAPHSGLNYVFSHYFGVFLGATAIFVTYALCKKNKPTVNACVILPALMSGAIWGCGMVCLFLSNDLLTQTVTYPVLITIPGCVASMWSIHYFKEIEMNRGNTLIIAFSFSMIFTGAALSFLSRSKVHLEQLLPFFK